jgi:phosphatidylglycerol:prolipoprotein diacylglycerol transferase
MIFPLSGTLDPRHPSQLYQAFAEGLGLFFVMLFFSKKKLPTGTLSGIFLVGYGTTRFIIEFFREPDSFLGLLSFNLSMGQLLSAPLVGFGMLLILVSSRRRFKSI